MRNLVKSWKPKFGDAYWTVCTIYGGALSTEFFNWDDDMIDFCNYYCGNCFKSDEEAQAHLVEIYNKLYNRYNEEEV